MARVYRDAYGVPHVRADDVLDLARAQGRVVALDRAWQLEWLRRRAAGTTAELIGESGVVWDRFARRVRIGELAQRALDALTDETRAFVGAYVEGVNEGLADGGRRSPELARLDASAEPWTATTPLATFHAQHVLFSSLGGQLWRERVEAELGAEALPLLSHEGPPEPSGSNAWAVGGARTASGRPLIGGDPHRTIESPGVYLQVRLACEDPDDAFDVAGFAFAGVPGVQHFAHAGDVAWAITNAAADHQTGWPEHDPPRDVVEQHRETIGVRDGEPVEVDVVRTERGLVVEPGLSLADAADVLGSLGFEALLPLLRARTVDDVDRALDHWVEPVNNAVIADVHGVVRYRIAGRVPTRDGDGAWTGWLDPVPRHDVGPDGQVVTANERRGPESDLIGTEFAPPHRARRIAALLEGRTGLTTADFAAVHDDALLGTVPALLALVPGAFEGFDGVMAADSTLAGEFAAWRWELAQRVTGHPVLDVLRAPLREHDPVFDPWLNVVARVALALPQLADARTPLGIDMVALAQEALAGVRSAVRADGASAWGERHVFAPVHVFDTVDGLEAPPVPAPGLSGDSDCVRCTGSYPGLDDACSRGSVARYVWDLADREAGGWVVPMGASGDPDSLHHHDQLDAWTTAALVPIVSDWSRLTPEP